MIIEIILLIVLILCGIEYYLRNNESGRCLANIPGPKGWPLFGNLFLFLVAPDQLWDIGRKLDRLYYPFYKLRSFNISVVTIFEPETVEIVLSSTQHIRKGIAYKLLQPWFGTGLLTSTGAKWQKRRKILTPAFHFKKYLDIIAENSENLVQSLKAQKVSTQSLVPLLCNCTLNVICEAAMGTSLQEKESESKEYKQAVYDMGHFIIHRLLRPWLHIDWIFNWTSFGQTQKKVLNILHGFSTNIIKERKVYHEKTRGHFLKQLLDEDMNSETGETEVLGYRKKRLAMLDLLIAAQKDGSQIDDLGIREEVDTFIFEGHDTSAMGMVFSLLLIAEHKDAQDRIRTEMNEVLNESGGKLGYAELQRLNYLERVIKESLRLYPSVPFISRQVDQNLTLKGHTIPKGTMIDIHIFDMHMDPNLWPEPEKFDPDRFLPEPTQKRHPFAYIPFSAGPRNCIGQKFAMMEMKSLIGHLVHNFYLEPVDLAHEVPKLPDLVIRPARPVHVKFVPIEI